MSHSGSASRRWFPECHRHRGSRNPHCGIGLGMKITAISPTNQTGRNADRICRVIMVASPPRRWRRSNVHGRFTEELTGRTMRQIAVVATIAMLMSDVAAADVVRHSSIPQAYWGTWVGAGDAGTSESIIVLSARSYLAPEENCSVVSVSQTAGARGSIYSAHLRCVRPAESAGTTAANLIIRPESSDQIAIGPEFMHLKSFRRCAETVGAMPDSRPSEVMSSTKPRIGAVAGCRRQGRDTNLPGEN
jgi:hypothetical protein